MTAQANILVQNLMSQMNNDTSEDEKNLFAKRPKTDVNPLTVSFNDGSNPTLSKEIKLPFNPTSISDVQKIQNLNIQQLMALGQLMSTIQNPSNLQGLQGGPPPTPSQRNDCSRDVNKLLGNSSPSGPVDGNQQQQGNLSSTSTLNWSGSSNMNPLPAALTGAVGKPGLLPSPSQRTAGPPSLGHFNQNVAAAANFMRNLQVLAAAQQLTSGSNSNNNSTNQRATSVNKDKNANLGGNSLLGSPLIQNSSTLPQSSIRSGSVNSSLSGSSGNYNEPTNKRLSDNFYNQDSSKRSGLLPEPELNQSNQSMGRLYDRISSSVSTSRGRSLGSGLSISSYSRSGLFSSGHNYQSGSNGSSGSGFVGGNGASTSVTSGTSVSNSSFNDYSNDMYSNQYGNSNNDQYYEKYSNYYDNQSNQSNYLDQDEGGNESSYNTSSKSQTTSDYSSFQNTGEVSGSFSNAYSDNYYGTNSNIGQYEGPCSNYTNNSDGNNGYWGIGASSSGASSYNKGSFSNDSINSNPHSNYSNYSSSSLSSGFGSASSSFGSSSSSYSSHYGTSGSFNSGSTMTSPVGQKRSYSHLLPPPEASPEGGYIGQHSQGIGGHYADSYAKRKRYDSSVLSKGTGYY